MQPHVARHGLGVGQVQVTLGTRTNSRGYSNLKSLFTAFPGRASGESLDYLFLQTLLTTTHQVGNASDIDEEEFLTYPYHADIYQTLWTINRRNLETKEQQWLSDWELVKFPVRHLLSHLLRLETYMVVPNPGIRVLTRSACEVGTVLCSEIICFGDPRLSHVLHTCFCSKMQADETSLTLVPAETSSLRAGISFVPSHWLTVIERTTQKRNANSHLALIVLGSDARMENFLQFLIKKSLSTHQKKLKNTSSRTNSDYKSTWLQQKLCLRTML
eukprot:g13150.t1